MIRAARPGDRDAIVAVTHAAFDGEETAMRVIREVEPEISLVWDEDGAVVGHVMLSRMTMAERRPLQLSPLSVAPSHQNRGIGRYYPRFGFEPAKPLGLETAGADSATPGWRRNWARTTRPCAERSCSRRPLASSDRSRVRHEHEFVTDCPQAVQSVRGSADDFRMEATLRLLAWAGVIVAAAVSAALAFGVLFGT